MPKAARITDVDTGHGCFPASDVIVGSGDVFFNDLAVARVGDALAAHGCPVCIPHARSIVAGSGTVFVNDMPVARIGDAIDCGGTLATGSGDVDVG